MYCLVSSVSLTILFDIQEIKFEPNIMCERIDKKATFRASQVNFIDDYLQIFYLLISLTLLKLFSVANYHPIFLWSSFAFVFFSSKMATSFAFRNPLKLEAVINVAILMFLHSWNMFIIVRYRVNPFDVEIRISMFYDTY